MDHISDSDMDSFSGCSDYYVAVVADEEISPKSFEHLSSFSLHDREFDSRLPLPSLPRISPARPFKRSLSISRSNRFREDDLCPLKIIAEEGVHEEVQYPYPEHLNVEELVPNKLYWPDEVGGYVEWNKNYVEWRQKLWDVIKSEGLLGFIEGTVQAPPKTVITSVNAPNGGNTRHRVENEKYVAWKRSGHLVRDWILNTLTEDWRKDYETAKELWEYITRWEQRYRMRHYLPLYNAATNGDWQSADKIIQEDQEAVRARITFVSETALIVAVKMVGGKNFVEKLVEKMSLDDLAICDGGGRTALHRAAGFGHIEVAKLLVGKNKDLPNMKTHSGESPLFYAAERGDKKMVEWLMEVTDLDEVFSGECGFKILYELTHSQLYDIALKVLEDNSELAYPYWKEDCKVYALTTLAGKPSSFKSGNNFNFLQEFIYSSMKFPTKKEEGMESEHEGMELENIADNHNREDIEVPPVGNNSGAANGGWAYAVRKKLHAIFSKVSETLFDQILIIKPIREIREKKLLHNQALDLLKFLCEEAIRRRNFFEADRNFRLPLQQATSMGIHEIVEEILRVYPSAIYLENNKKQSIFQQAIVFRQEKVFNLIYQHEESRATVLSKGASLKNNALHLAGYVAHPQQLYRRAGAALQMQRELQWFKEVERLVLPKNREERNQGGKTPAQVFSDAHRELVKEGERWMKDTAGSCTIIAALIATVVFAAAIQVPGGNNNNGLPNFNPQPAFIVFGIFNALALFSSIASVLLFLSILTSRYAEEDFLVTLPKRLIIGLICLFLSILFTMTAFGATLYLVFGEKKGWILIPVVALGCLPVALFSALQFPLLKDMIKSTWGSGIFDRKRDRISNRLDIKKGL